MIMTETQFDLDYELVCHLADETSVLQIRKEKIKPVIIEDLAVREIFEWQMSHLRDHKQIATRAVIEAEFDIAVGEPQTAVNDLMDRLRDRYGRNEGRESIRRVTKLYSEEPAALGKQMMEEGRKLARLTTKQGDVFGTGDLHRALAQYDNRVTQGPGPSLGFEELDLHFNGMLGVTFLIGAPKTYKSWMTVNALIENVMSGKKVDLYSLELPAVESDWRVRCMAANVPYWKYLKGKLTPEDRQKIKSASEILDDHGGYTIRKPPRGARSVAEIVDNSSSDGADVIMIDQLQYMENRNGNSIGAANNTGDYFEVVNDMRDFSDDIPIFVVHQFNRSVQGSNGFPEMQQAKGSSSIEEVATLALGLWANKEMRQNNQLEVGALASRNYSYKNWRLQVNLSHGCGIDMIGVSEDEE